MFRVKVFERERTVSATRLLVYRLIPFVAHPLADGLDRRRREQVPLDVDSIPLAFGHSAQDGVPERWNGEHDDNDDHEDGDDAEAHDCSSRQAEQQHVRRSF